jgi:hypothetical protein
VASSGTLALNRPDKIRVTRSGGFAAVEMFFDEKTLTLVGKNLNIHAQQDVPGTIDNWSMNCSSRIVPCLPRTCS